MDPVLIEALAAALEYGVPAAIKAGQTIVKAIQDSKDHTADQKVDMLARIATARLKPLDFTDGVAGH